MPISVTHGSPGATGRGLTPYGRYPRQGNSTTRALLGVWEEKERARQQQQTFKYSAWMEQQRQGQQQARDLKLREWDLADAELKREQGLADREQEREQDIADTDLGFRRKQAGDFVPPRPAHLANDPALIKIDEAETELRTGRDWDRNREEVQQKIAELQQDRQEYIRTHPAPSPSTAWNEDLIYVDPVTGAASDTFREGFEPYRKSTGEPAIDRSGQMATDKAAAAKEDATSKDRSSKLWTLYQKYLTEEDDSGEGTLRYAPEEAMKKATEDVDAYFSAQAPPATAPTGQDIVVDPKGGTAKHVEKPFALPPDPFAPQSSTPQATPIQFPPQQGTIDVPSPDPDLHPDPTRQPSVNVDDLDLGSFGVFESPEEIARRRGEERSARHQAKLGKRAEAVQKRKGQSGKVSPDGKWQWDNTKKQWVPL